MPTPTKMLLDCDTGVDDAMAIACAAVHPAIELLGVGSVFGNVDLDNTTRNTRHVLNLFGATDVPVARGAAGPMDGSQPFAAGNVHGQDGLGGVAPASVDGSEADCTAAEQVVDVCRRFPGEVSIVAVGPLTNIAHALELEPRLPELVGDVTIMGGAALAPGNVTPAAEVNIYFDPDAAAKVFAAPWPLTVVPLDATMRVHLTESQRTRLAASDHPGCTMLAAAFNHYMDFYEQEMVGERKSAQHDVVAVGVAADLVEVTNAPTVTAEVDTGDGPARGTTVFDLRGLYRDDPSIPDATTTVVLETDPDFAESVLATLLTT